MSSTTPDTTKGTSPSSTSKLRLDITIVGAGIGGLTVAHRLSTSGHRVTVIEGAQSLGEIGAGILLSPNVTRLFERWGFGEQLKEVVTVSEGMIIRRYENGEVLNSIPLGGLAEREYGAPSYQIHRADLHRILLSATEPLVKIKLGSKAISIDPSTASVTLASGEVVQGDLVIGADGLRSKVLEVVLGRKSAEIWNPKHTGDAAFRALIPSDLLREDPDLREFADEGRVNIWVGPERHFVGYAIRRSEIYNLVMLHTARDAEETPRPGELESLKEEFANFEPRVRKMVDLVTSTTLWPLLDRDPLESWFHESGKICLLGDACHPMLPYRAQGAAMAIEDAAVLSNLLSRITCKSQLPEILKAYQELRHKRATANQLGSRFAQKLYHLSDGPDQEARDASMKSAMVAGGKIARGLTMSEDDPGMKILNAEREKGKFAYGYDADADVESWVGKHWGNITTFAGKN